MRLIHFLTPMFFCLTFLSNAQNTVTVDASAMQNRSANIFETPANGGSYLYGEPIAMTDLKTIADSKANTITLRPNFDSYADNPTDPFWVDQTTLSGNKVFEGNTFVEDNSLVGSNLTFEGTVKSYTLDTGYVVIAFIKVFNEDFSVVKIESETLTSAQDFSMTYTDVESTDVFVQYGFSVTGMNANPADKSTLGSVVIEPKVLSTNDKDPIKLSAHPNPVHSVWNLRASENITRISLKNTLGQIVYDAAPNTLYWAVDMSHLKTGVYMANVSIGGSSASIKLVKE